VSILPKNILAGTRTVVVAFVACRGRFRFSREPAGTCLIVLYTRGRSRTFCCSNAWKVNSLDQEASTVVHHFHVLFVAPKQGPVAMAGINIDRKWLEAPLQGAHVYRGVPYIQEWSKGDKWQCDLCSTGVMWSARSARKHCSGKRHRRLHSILEASRKEEARKLEMSDKLRQVQEVSPRVEKLGSEKWIWHVNDALLRYMTSIQPINVALGLLLKYELMARLSLLELAIWKASCLSDCQFDTMQDIEDWALNGSFHPADYKQEKRAISGVHVIITLILPFL
jgi:hypothetical protein